MKRSMTQAERLHLNRVAEVPCVVCGNWPVTIHHCGTKMGGGRSHTKVAALCWEHHLGPEGIDGKRMGKRRWEAKYGTEQELMEKTIKKLTELFPNHIIPE